MPETSLTNLGTPSRDESHSGPEFEWPHMGAPKIWNFTEASETVTPKPAAGEDMRPDLARAIQLLVMVLLGMTLLVLIEMKTNRQAVLDPPWAEVGCAIVFGYAIGRWHSLPPR